jgi:hypothetical protein
LSEKEKSNGTSNARFVTVNITAKTMKRQKIQRVDVNRKLKRSNGVDNIAMCKSQTGWKLQL